MSQSSVSRQQRRQMERDMQKKNSVNTQQDSKDTEYITKKEIQLLVQDVQKILNYVRIVDSRVNMLVETLDRRGIINWGDISRTEALYTLKEKKRQEEIKRILSLDIPIKEILDIIKEIPEKLGYEKLEIDPIKDLNLNPYELGAYLREINPELSQEGLMLLGKKWGMTPENFGFKTNKTSL